ncbi:MAG: hypothetical protein FH748_10185 [Balneolaceae bacterium]|nr:hypothetical protein [Balneolaceae bacterium]
MSIKKYINNFVAILAVVTLVSGFQISDSQGIVQSLETTIGVEEAYAGPCGRRGCDGTAVYCTSYVVLEIGNTRWIRDCEGVIQDDDGDGPGVDPE